MRRRRKEEVRNGAGGGRDGKEGDEEYDQADAKVNGERDGLEEILDLGFGKCKLQVQVPENGAIAKPEELVGKKVVTSFLGLTEQYFRKLEREEDARRGVAADGEMRWRGEERKLRTNIIHMGGSVEAACALGVADGIVDLVESGETMRAAGLKAIDTVVESKAVLIKSKTPKNPKLVDLIASRINGVISKSRHPTFYLINLSVEMLTWSHSCTKVHPLPVQHPPQSSQSCIGNHTWQARSHCHSARRRGMGSCQRNG